MEKDILKYLYAFYIKGDYEQKDLTELLNKRRVRGNVDLVLKEWQMVFTIMVINTYIETNNSYKDWAKTSDGHYKDHLNSPVFARLVAPLGVQKMEKINEGKNQSRLTKVALFIAFCSVVVSIITLIKTFNSDGKQLVLSPQINNSLQTTATSIEALHHSLQQIDSSIKNLKNTTTQH